MRVAIDLYQARLRAPWVSSQDSVDVRPLIRLRLEAGDGIVGHGEAAPLAGYDGVTIARVRAGLDACRRILARDAGLDREAVLAECAEQTDLPQALAAIDLALWDMAGKRVGEPVWRLLGAGAPPQVAVNDTIGAATPQAAAAAALTAAAAGFGCVKLKVGVGDDAARVAAIRAATGSALQIRLDANGAWSVEAAIAELGRLAASAIECCEEPVHGLEAIERVAAATTVPIALDETAGDPGALARRAGTAVCLKIARCGGISGVIRDAAAARAAGYEVYLASTLDGPLGIAAALHAAAVVNPDRPCGLATLRHFTDPDPLPAVRGRISAPSGPGLGVS